MNKEIILIILATLIMFCIQWYKQRRKKNDYWKKYRQSKGWE